MDALQNARGLIKESLKPFFKGKTAEERLEKATAATLEAIGHLVTTRTDAPKNKLGVTVMTESASANKRIAPRRI